MGKSKTVSDVSTIGIMSDSGELNRTLLLEDMKYVGLGMSTVLQSRGNTIAQMKGLLNDGLMTVLGYNPTEEVLMKEVDTNLLLNWARNNIDGSIGSVSNVRVGPLGNDTMLFEWLLDTNPTFDLHTKRITYNGAVYDYGAVWEISDSTLQARYVRPFEDTGIPWLNANYPGGYTVTGHSDTRYAALAEHWVVYFDTPDGNSRAETVTAGIYAFTAPNDDVNAAATIVAEYSGTQFTGTVEVVDGDSYTILPYVTTVTIEHAGMLTFTGSGEMVHSWGTITYPIPFSDSAEYRLLKSQVDSVVAQANNAAINDAEYVIFDYSNGTDGIGYVLRNAVPGLFKNTAVSAYPLIPLKKNFTMINDSTNRQVLMNRFGFQQGDFDESIESSQVHTAYLAFSLKLLDTNEYAVKGLYHTFRDVVSPRVPGEYNFDVSFDEIAFRFRANVEVEYREGWISQVGEYSSETSSYYTYHEDDVGGYVTQEHRKVEYRKQETDSTYVAVIVTDAESSYQVQGGARVVTDDLFSDDCRVPLFFYVLDKLPFIDYLGILERSFTLIAYVQQTIKLKWYQSGFFKFIMSAVGLVLAIYTGNPYLVAFSMGMSIAVQAGLISGEVAAVMSIVMAAYGMYSGPAEGATMLQSSMFYAANIITIVSSVNNWYYGNVLENMARRLNASNKALEEEQEAYKEDMEDKGNALYTFTDAKTVDGFYDIALGSPLYDTDYLLYDRQYDYDRYYS